MKLRRYANTKLSFGTSGSDCLGRSNKEVAMRDAHRSFGTRLAHVTGLAMIAALAIWVAAPSTAFAQAPLPLTPATCQAYASGDVQQAITDLDGSGVDHSVVPTLSALPVGFQAYCDALQAALDRGDTEEAAKQAAEAARVQAIAERDAAQTALAAGGGSGHLTTGISASWAGIVGGDASGQVGDITGVVGYEPRPWAPLRLRLGLGLIGATHDRATEGGGDTAASLALLVGGGLRYRFKTHYAVGGVAEIGTIGWGGVARLALHFRLRWFDVEMAYNRLIDVHTNTGTRLRALPLPGRVNGDAVGATVVWRFWGM